MRVTEIKTVKVGRVCGDQPVFMSWLDHKGGRNYWLFYKTQTESVATVANGDFEPTVVDLETARGQIYDINIFAQPKLTVYATVDNEDIQGLQSILYSNNVEMLTNPDTWEVDGVKWQTRRPETGSFKIRNTDEVESDIEITFNLPHLNTPSN